MSPLNTRLKELDGLQTINDPQCGVGPADLTEQQRSVSSAPNSQPTRDE